MFGIWSLFVFISQVHQGASFVYGNFEFGVFKGTCKFDLAHSRSKLARSKSQCQVMCPGLQCLAFHYDEDEGRCYFFDQQSFNHVEPLEELSWQSKDIYAVKLGRGIQHYDTSRLISIFIYNLKVVHNN